MYLHSEEMLDSEDASQGVYSMRQRGSTEQKRCTPASEQDGSKSGCRHGPLAINWVRIHGIARHALEKRGATSGAALGKIKAVL